MRYQTMKIYSRSLVGLFHQLKGEEWKVPKG